MSFFCLSIFRLLEGKTQPAPLLFSPLSAASCARARLAFSAEIHPFPPALRFVRNSRSAQSALTEKRGFRWRELNFIWVQRHAAAQDFGAKIHLLPPKRQSPLSRCAHRKARDTLSSSFFATVLSVENFQFLWYNKL